MDSHSFFLALLLVLAYFLHPTEDDHSFLEHLRGRMRPIIYLFSPIFFVYVGLSIDLSIIDFTSKNF